MMSEVHEKVDRLLHDAEHADAGREMAQMMGDLAAWKRLAKKRDKLRAEALALDPDKTAPAWQEDSDG